MTEYEELFHKIAQQVPDAIEGKMFGALCIKSTNGKACAIFWKGSMLFKLDDKGQAEALKLDGAEIGSHLYAPNKPMKGWVLIPSSFSEKWLSFTIKAIAYVKF